MQKLSKALVPQDLFLALRTARKLPSHTQTNIQSRSMAGHNKWSKIRHKKGANDVKKALALGKASKSLTVIAKECKGDRSDPRLQAAIQHAKVVKLPKDRIEEAIERASGAASQENEFFPLRFDAMMRLENSDTGDSVQVACIVTALSDNRNRTTQHIRHLVTKHGGEFLPTDHLNYLFEKVGHIEVQSKELESDQFNREDLEEELMECALEAGATNVEEMENDDDDDDENDNDEFASSSTRFLVTTAETDLWKVARAMIPENEEARANLNYAISNCEHRYVLKEDYGSAEYVDIATDSEAHERLGEFLDKLEEDEDVDKVYHNAALV